MNSESADELSAGGDNNQISGEQEVVREEEQSSFAPLKSEETILNEDSWVEKHLREAAEGDQSDKDFECDTEAETSSLSTPPAPPSSTTRLDVSPLDVMELALDTHWELLSSEARYQLSLIPEGYQPVPHQVGGHRHIDGKQGFLQRVGQPEHLLKPVFPGRKGEAELAFYENVWLSNEVDSVTINLRPLVPRYYGTEVIHDNRGVPSTYMRLEDITSKFRKPCVMDLKLGRRVWDDSASQDKIDREMRKYPIQETVGFRIIGMRVYQTDSCSWKYVDRHFGRSRACQEEVYDGVLQYLHQGGKTRFDLVPVILSRVEQIRQWLESQRQYRLYATSLLFVYEGDVQNDEDPMAIDVRMVDFAHTVECATSCLDENFLFGVDRVAAFFQSIGDRK